MLISEVLQRAKLSLRPCQVNNIKPGFRIAVGLQHLMLMPQVNVQMVLTPELFVDLDIESNKINSKVENSLPWILTAANIANSFLSKESFACRWNRRQEIYNSDYVLRLKNFNLDAHIILGFVGLTEGWIFQSRSFSDILAKFDEAIALAKELGV